MGSNPTVCAKSSTLRGAAFYFCGKLCKGCKVRFEQPVPGALRPAGQKCPGGAFLGRGRVRASAPKAVPCGVLLIIFAANYARVARWDSNSPCPALCVPPGCNSPADCCKGAGESPRLRQVSLLNFTLGSDFFIAALQNPRAFLIDISPLFSSSDFRVRYKSYQQSRQIAIHRTTQDSSRSLGTN